MDADQRTLKKIENEILKLLADSSVEDILDTDDLINILDNSKTISSDIHKRMAEAKVTEAEVNQTRLEYTQVAVRGVILYFVIADMALVNDMY